MPRRNLFDFHTLRPKQYSSDVRTTQTELISSFSRTCFSQTFSFLFCPIFFFFFFIYIIVYLPFSPQNLFFPSFFNLQRFKKFSYTNYQTKFRRKRNEIEFRRFFDNIILHTRTNTKSFEQPFEDSRYRLTNN